MGGKFSLAAAFCKYETAWICFNGDSIQSNLDIPHTCECGQVISSQEWLQ